MLKVVLSTAALPRQAPFFHSRSATITHIEEYR